MAHLVLLGCLFSPCLLQSSTVECINCITKGRHTLSKGAWLAFMSCSLLQRIRRVNFAVVSRSFSQVPMDDEVLATMSNGVGEVVLNRPKALNSLNTTMMERLEHVYNTWGAPGSQVNCIVLKGAGGKAFCAGGDVKQVALWSTNGAEAAALDFFRREYTVDYLIARLGLPHISLLDGIVMGGGAGVSVHGHFRVATERTLFAMPELAIGLFPDVGMMHPLSQLPGHLGMYLALTGARLKGVALKEVGLATHYLPSTALPALQSRLQRLGAAARDLSAVHNALTEAEAAAGPAPEPSGLLDKLPLINRAFGAGSVSGVLGALKAESLDREWAQESLQQITKGSPLSAAITHAYMQRVTKRRLSLADVLHTDYALCSHLMHGEGDFQEGVRARLIDKDDAPKWKHASVSEVPMDVVERLFTPRAGTPPLVLPSQEAGATAKL